MTTLPTWPYLLDTVPATRGSRLVRTLLCGAFVLIPGWLLGAMALSFLGDAVPEDAFTRAWWYAAAISAGVGLVAFVGAGWAALAGRAVPDFVLGLRTVQVATGGRPGWRGVGRASVMGLMGVLSAGTIPLVLALVARDEDGRSWQDRWAGLAVIDLRLGRDVALHPVTAAELASRFAPVKEPRPAIIQVRPSGQRPVPSPVPAAPPIPPRRTGDVRPSAPPAMPAGATVPPQPTWVLRFDTGQTHELRSLALLGRQPSARTTHPGADLVVVDDPSRTISATHLAVRANEVGVWVEDLGSTNGSEVVLANGRVKDLAVRAPASIDAGARVRFGDRVMRIQRVGAQQGANR